MDAQPPAIVQPLAAEPQRPAAIPRRVVVRRTRTPAAGPPEPLPDDGELYGPSGVYANIPVRDDRGRDQIPMFKRWNPDPVGNHERNLAAVKPQLAAVVRRAIADNPGLRFVVGSGIRSEAEQRQAGVWGWSPWPTLSSRIPALRKHMDGEAVDLWPLDPAGRVTFDPALLARVGAAMKRAAAALGVRLSWGGDWRTVRKDLPHFELR